MQSVPQTLRIDPALKRRVAEAAREKYLRLERDRQADLGEPGRLGGLLQFVRWHWSILEPGRRFVEGKPLEAMALHLEAVTRGEIRLLLINVSPGSMKSLLVNVFWPLWEWSAAGMPELRYVSFSYAAHLTERDNGRMRDLVRSHLYQELWGDSFKLTEDGKIKIANDRMGWKFASSVRGIGTGERGDRILLDDPHNVKEGESEAVRTETVRWFREAMSNRLNDQTTGVIIIIMQRVHEDDVAGSILDGDEWGYTHLSIPNEFDAMRQVVPTAIGWVDWRTQDGELAWPERISREETERLKRQIGPYAYTGQYQQIPEPRGGGIFKRDWWGNYPLVEKEGTGKGKPLYPPHFVIASLDPAYTAKTENDPSGFTVWGVYRDRKPASGEAIRARSVRSIMEGDGPGGVVSDAYQPLAKIALLYAWQKRLELHGLEVRQNPGESRLAYIERAKRSWGLVEWVAHDCTRLQVDILLIENKASGIDVFHEIRRLYRGAKWGVQQIDPGGLDKRSRAYAIQHLFSDGLVHAPNRDWADMVISEFAKFRGLTGDEDNLVDSGTQALKWLRDMGILVRQEEHRSDEEAKARYVRQLEPLYGDV
jgi:hypothetical protein